MKCPERSEPIGFGHLRVFLIFPFIYAGFRAYYIYLEGALFLLIFLQNTVLLLVVICSAQCFRDAELPENLHIRFLCSIATLAF